MFPLGTIRAVRLLLTVTFSFCFFSSAAASAFDENSDYAKRKLKLYVDKLYELSLDPNKSESRWLSEFSSLNATTEPGEPTFGGLMKRTVWAGFTAPESGRVFISTLGSNYDTVLAVYRGDASASLASLVNIALNDDRSISGVGYRQSLVQFDVTKNATYSIQLGSKTTTAGIGRLDYSLFPPGGGLSASLATVGGYSGYSTLGDFICLGSCLSPRFVLHNSTSQTLTVTVTNSLGAGVSAYPAQVTLAPNAVASTLFTFPAFDNSTPRTISGAFIFTAKAGPTVVSIARHRALIVLKPGVALPDILRVSNVFPAVRTGGVNEPLTYKVKLTNIGSITARGCHVRGAIWDPVRTIWQRIDPATGDPIGNPNTPVDIPGHQSVWLDVTTAAQRSRIANPTFAGNNQQIYDCANTEKALVDLSNNFDFTARGLYDPVDVFASTVSPTNGVLSVAQGGYATFKVRIVNTSPTATLVARPEYLRPADETDPSKQYIVRVCPANASGTCTVSLNTSVTFSAPQYSPRYFTVYVWSPVTDPGYDPRWRRVFLVFDQVQPPGSTVYSVPVAAQSVAVKRN